MAGMAYAAAPWAYAAKLTSEMYDLFKSRYQEIFPET